MKFEEFSNVLTKWINSLELIQHKCNNVINVADKLEFMDTLFTKLFNREHLTYTTALKILNENYPKFNFNGSGSEFNNFVPFLGLLMFDKVVKSNEKIYQTMLLKYVEEDDHHVFQQFFEYLVDYDATIISYDIVTKAIHHIDSKSHEFNNLDCSVYESSQQSFTNISTKVSTPLKTFFDTPKTDKSKRQNEVIQALRDLLEAEQKEKQELIEDFNETKRQLEMCQQHLKTKSGQFEVLKDEHEEVITENDHLKEIEIRSRELQTRVSNLEKQVFDLQNKNDQLGSENNTLLDKISDLEVINEDQEINILVQKQIIEDEHIKYDKLALDLLQVNDEKNLLNSAKEELESMVKELTAKHQPVDFNDSSWSIDESFSFCKRADVSTQSEKSQKNLKEELLETENEKLKFELQKLAEEYHMKVSELNKNQMEIKQLNMQIQDQNSEIINLNDRKDFLRDELQQTIRILQNELNTSKLSHQQITEEYEIVSKLNSEFIEELKTKDNLADNLKCELKLLKNEFDKLDNELQSKSNMFHELETKYVDEIHKLEQLKKSQLSQIQELTEKLKKVNDEKHEAKMNLVKSLEQYRDEFNELNLKHKSLSSQVESLRKDKHDLNHIICQLTEKANQFETENDLLHNQIDKMKLNLEDEEKLKSDNEKLASELEIVTNRLLILENTIDSHSNVFDSDVKDNLESKINHLVNIIEQKTALLAVKDMKINELTLINDHVNESLQNLQIIKSGLEDNLNLKSEQLEQCSIKIENFEVELNENSKTLKMYELKNAALEQQISTTENSLRNLQNEKKTIFNINQILETKLKDLENLQNFESDKFLNTLHEKECEIEMLKNRCSNSNLIIDGLKENLSQKSEDCNQLKIQLEHINETFEQFAQFLKSSLSDSGSDSDYNAVNVRFEDDKFAILVPVVLEFKKTVDEKLLENDITRSSLIKLFDKLNEEKALLMNDKVLLQKENAQLLEKLNHSKDKQNHELESLKMQLKDYNDVKTEIAQLEKLKNMFIEEKSKLIEKLLNEKASIDKQMLRQNQNVKQLSDKLNSLQFLKSKVSKKFEEIELKKTLVDVALGAARKLLNASIRQILSDVVQCDKKYDSNFNKVLNTKNFDERFLIDFNVEYFNDVNEKIVEVNQFINDYAKMLQILEDNCEKSDMERLKQIAVEEEYKQKYYTVKQKIYSVERSSHKLEEQLQIVLEKNRILKEQLKLYENKQMNSESCEVKIVNEVKRSFENELSNVKLEWNKKLEIERSKLIQQHEADILKLKTDFEEKLKRNTNFYKEKYEKVCKMYQNHDELYLKEVSEEQHKGVLRENRLKAELDERNATINSLREQLKDISMKYVSLKNEPKHRNGFATAEKQFLAKCEEFNILDFAIDNENIVPEVKRLSSKPENSRPSSVFSSRHTLNEVSQNNNSSVGRLSELQYRNSLCLPHLKSTYPAETQFLKPTDFDENEVRVGNQFFINDSNVTLLPTEKSKKKDFGRKVRPSSPMKKRLEDQTLRENNNINCIPTLKKMSTPMRMRQLFTRKTPIKDKDQQENIETHKSTPKSRKLSLFRSK